MISEHRSDNRALGFLHAYDAIPSDVHSEARQIGLSIGLLKNISL